MITNDATCKRDIQLRITIAKAAFSKKKVLVTKKLDLNTKKKLVS